MDLLEILWKTINSSLTNILIIILTLLSILEIIDMYGIDIKLFSYSKRKIDKERKRIEATIDDYLNTHKEMFRNNSAEYINYILMSIGLKNGQLDKALSRIEELKNMNRVIKSKEEMYALINRLLEDSRVLVDLSKADVGRTVIYSGLKYYINLTDVMTITSIKVRVLSILHYHIEMVLSTLNMSVTEIDRLVIPTESNTILGIELAQLLNIEPIIMHNAKRRIYDDQYWDGNIAPGSRLLIIHDVIFSGDNIESCIHRLPNSCAILGVIALINRTDKEALFTNKIGKGLIEETGVKVYSAIDIDDEYLHKIVNNESKTDKKGG